MRRAGAPPGLLLTTVDEATGAVAHHGIPRELLVRQAAATGLPLTRVAVPRGAPNAVYEQRMRESLTGVAAVAFGDLFLEDLRAYREQRMAEAGRSTRFPLWGSDTTALARAIVDAGFRATVVSVDLAQLPDSALGRRYDHAFLDALPPHVDPCGERGEFHTFVTAGPVLDEPLAITPGAVRSDGRHAWLAVS
jgi:uncharacterized protein (TIGR00290 family)